MEKNKLTKEKYSPITTRSKQVSFFEKKDRVIFKTLESNEKLMIPKKVKKKVEINDKKFKNKKNFNLRIIQKQLLYLNIIKQNYLLSHQQKNYY